MMALRLYPTYARKIILGKIEAMQQVRKLNLLEYQSKKLLKKYGVTVQDFKVLENKEEDNDVISKFDCSEYVVKAQILAGGRGKGVFQNGLRSGVHITSNKYDVLELSRKMIGSTLITPQTPDAGIIVKKVMVARSVNIVRETYLCILLDQTLDAPVLIASPKGGMDIETIAKETPEMIKSFPLDIEENIPDEVLIDIAKFLKFQGDRVDRCIREVQKLYNMFKAVDAVQIEINPFAETDSGDVISIDAKLSFDDNSRFRQSDIFTMDHVEDVSDIRETEAAMYNLNYISMNGNIGCLVNGAGLAMATMDIIKLNKGRPANFLDVGGGVKEEQVLKALQILTSEPNVKAIMVNIFGGIVDCAVIANGIVTASKAINMSVPLVVRLEGTNAERAREILSKSGMAIITAFDLDDAAKKAVACVN